MAYKKQATFKEYTIGVRENNSIEVLVDGKPYDGAVKPLLRDTIAPQIGLSLEEKWNTQILGRKIVDHINLSSCSSECDTITPEPIVDMPSEPHDYCRGLHGLKDDKGYTPEDLYTEEKTPASPISKDGTFRKFRVDMIIEDGSCFDLLKIDSKTLTNLKKIKTRSEAEELLSDGLLGEWEMDESLLGDDYPYNTELKVYDVTGMDEEGMRHSEDRQVFHCKDEMFVLNHFNREKPVEPRPKSYVNFTMGKYIMKDITLPFIDFSFIIEDTEFDIDQLQFQPIEDYSGIFYNNWTSALCITYRGKYLDDIDIHHDIVFENTVLRIVEKKNNDNGGWKILKTFEDEEYDD